MGRHGPDTSVLGEPIDFESKVVLVTGAASGIGRAVVDRVLADGGSVVAVDLTTDSLPESERVVTLAGDVTDQAVNETAVALAVSKFGRLDGAALNAGIAMRGDLLALPLESYDRAMEVNVRAVLVGIRAAVPVMQGQGTGSIVVTASTSGIGGDPGMWAYNASKAAVINLVRAASLDLGPQGIRINAVAPGPTETGMTQRARADPESYENLRRRTALQRWAKPEEVGAVIAFLLSDDASIVTGAVVPADAGIGASTGQFLPETS